MRIGLDLSSPARIAARRQLRALLRLKVNGRRDPAGQSDPLDARRHPDRIVRGRDDHAHVHGRIWPIADRGVDHRGVDADRITDATTDAHREPDGDTQPAPDGDIPRAVR